MSPEDPILKQAGLNIARKLAEKYRSIDALSRVPMGDCQQGLGLLTELFEHIDTQAAQIEALKEEADCSDIVLALEDAGIMGDGEQDIITAIEILGSRIDAMKEKLVEE